MEQSIGKIIEKSAGNWNSVWCFPFLCRGDVDGVIEMGERVSPAILVMWLGGQYENVVRWGCVSDETG